MNCPKCNSSDTQKFSMIYESGTSIVDMKGVKVYDRGSVVSNAQLAGRSETRTLLAKRVMPPSLQTRPLTSRRSYGTFWKRLGFFLLFFVFLIIGITDLSYNRQFPLFGVLFLILALLAVYKAVRAGSGDQAYDQAMDDELKRQWQEQMNVWNNSWLCLRCGNEFAESSTGIVATESIRVRIRKIRDSDGKMAAIKFYVEATNCNLLEAKKYVENL